MWERPVTWAMVRATASRSSAAALISASARFLLSWLKSSHCWRVDELRGQDTAVGGVGCPACAGAEMKETLLTHWGHVWD